MITFYTLAGKKLGESDFKTAIPRIGEEVIKKGESYQVSSITHKLSGSLGKCSEVRVTCKLLGCFIGYVPSVSINSDYMKGKTQ